MLTPPTLSEANPIVMSDYGEVLNSFDQREEPKKEKHVFFQQILEHKSKMAKTQLVSHKDEFIPFLSERDGQGFLIKGEPK